MSTIEDAAGPVVVWENYGYEGWRPKSYPTFKEALMDRHYHEFVVTSRVEFDVVSVTNGDRT